MDIVNEVKSLLKSKNYRLVLAADAEPRVYKKLQNKIVWEVPSGGVAVALDPVAKATGAFYIARGKTMEDAKESDEKISEKDGSYTLCHVSLSEEELQGYYYGFSNQTLWPLCHVAFQMPQEHRPWYEKYKIINKRFADLIDKKKEKKSFVWIHDYQLALVPSFLKRSQDTLVAMFWHIPWPSYEQFRILSSSTKGEILESLLSCDFLAFHRGYQVRNFIETVQHECKVRIDQEEMAIYYKDKKTTVLDLPLGIDAASIIKLATSTKDVMNKDTFGIDSLFKNYQVILGIDRLDYTKGLLLRLNALEQFFMKHPKYRGKAVYIGILSPSRMKIAAYQELEQKILQRAEEINAVLARGEWKPIVLINQIFPRERIVKFYKESAVCLVTPVDDGMNLVSKEFVMAASVSKNPGMLVLSHFAGSAIDLTESIRVNPYDIDELESSIEKAFVMPTEEKIKRIQAMAQVLQEKNVYNWMKDFISAAVAAKPA